MGRVSGKVVFVTGAAKGQGRNHAIRFAEEGADIIVSDRATPYDAAANPQYSAGTAEELEETKLLVEKTGQRCVSAIADVRDRAAVQAAVDAGLSAFGHIDVVLANAGMITFHAKSWEIPDETYDLIVDTDMRGVWNTIVCTVPSMIEAKRGGSIIITSSSAGIRGQHLYAHYVGAKHAVVGFMRAFANELAPYRIRVNTVHPGGVDSPGMGQEGIVAATPLFTENPAAWMGVANVMPDLASPFDAPEPMGLLPLQDVTNAMLFLGSDESRYVTGIQLPVDTGCANKA
jgi:SDR family mycofactocin-dependent oxidoreductase